MATGMDASTRRDSGPVPASSYRKSHDQLSVQGARHHPLNSAERPYGLAATPHTGRPGEVRIRKPEESVRRIGFSVRDITKPVGRLKSVCYNGGETVFWASRSLDVHHSVKP